MKGRPLFWWVGKREVVIGLSVFAIVSTVNFAYSQEGGSVDATLQSEVLDLVVKEGIALLAGLLGLGVSAFIAWLNKRGIPVTSEQEEMFKNMVTQRFEKLAKDSWTEMRAHPEKLDEYWVHLSKGKVPPKFQEDLRKEGIDLAKELIRKKEFQDFAKGLTEDAMKRLLSDLRTQLKNDYQKQMLDVIPKLASIAVDSAFDPKVSNVDAWAKTALQNLKPLLLSTEAIDTEENLMIIIRSEINKRAQSILAGKV